MSKARVARGSETLPERMTTRIWQSAALGSCSVTMFHPVVSFAC